MRVLIILFVSIILINYVISKDDDDERKDAFVNDPIELKPVYHTPNKYEERSYDFWYENWPHPHVHGDKPLFDERHQHFPGYGDNYDFSNFITDPPTQNGAKSETVLEEASLIDEPGLDKSIKKSGSASSSASEEDSKDPKDPKKSIDQPKKDYESPSEPSISGEKLSKPISSLPAEVYSTSSSSTSSAQGPSPFAQGSSNGQGGSGFSNVQGGSSSAQGPWATQGSAQGPSSSINGRPGGPQSPYPEDAYKGSQSSNTGDAYNTKPSLPSSQSQTHSQSSIPARGGSEDEYFKSPPGVQPEVFPISKPNPEQQPYNNGGGGGASTQRPKPTPRVDEFFPEESEPEQSRQTLSPRKPLSPSSSESESSGVNGGGGDGESSGPRSCCPCCRDPNLTPAISPGAAGCGEPSCGPPPIVGRPPNCCQQAPMPCCPTLPTCCLPQLPCCPRIQLTCCPPIRICCQPLNFGCSGGCRSRAVTRLRTKRNGCVPCLNGRKKREIQEEEETHIRQKRLGCIPCLAREKRQAQQNCQKCNLFQQQIVRRVKRTFSCSSCATHHERVKRQSQIADFFRGNQLGNYGSNCQQCYDLPLPTRAMKKRSSGFSDGQHSFLARIKRAADGYDPLFQCDSGCCDYEKCIKSKPLKSESFKVPEDSDFISGTSSKDYDLPDLKEEEKSSSSLSSSDSKKEELIGSKDALSLGGSSSRGSDDRSFRS
uniref:Uncharacterized protein n=1 Tax=Panagrolaimus sp. PS1159 TaxID=55785 RepID=A0AC35G7P1_9BILA